MSLLLVPATRENLEKSIESSVNPEFVKKYLDERYVSYLLRQSGNEGIRCWAVTKNLKKFFEDIENGDEVLLTEKLATLGDQGDILLAAFSQYSVGLRSEMSLDRSQHVGFARDVETYRGILRGDGMGKWSSAYQPKTGSTLSWAVTLAARA